MPAKKKTSKKKIAKKTVSKKKTVKKKVAKKKIAKKTAQKKQSVKPKGIGSVKPTSKFYHTKFNLVTRQIILFAILFIVSVLLFGVSENQIYKDLFFLLSIIFGLVIIAFFIVLLIFLFLKIMKK